MENVRLYAQVASVLNAEIRKGAYEVGDRLPAERDLATQFNVSRPTIREAIIALEVDGLVEAVKGSGVYVISNTTREGVSHKYQMGMMELLEARRAFESEAAAIAAIRINDEEIETLRKLVGEMEDENKHDVELAEEIDRQFHLTIAQATRNAAIYNAIELFWDARRNSTQTQHFLTKTRAAGLEPNIDQHSKILRALEKRDSKAARKAMSDHLTAVIESVLRATEVQVLEETREKLRKQRELYLEGDAV